MVDHVSRLVEEDERTLQGQWPHTPDTWPVGVSSAWIASSLAVATAIAEPISIASEESAATGATTPTA